MMTVEEKPDVTYNDVGGCKEQIEQIREVVEVPLLHVRFFVIFLNYFEHTTNRSNSSQRDLSTLELIHQKEFCCMGLLELERLF